MKAINLFNQWVDLGKDEGMQLNHSASVNHMLEMVSNQVENSKFRFFDIGCGNGWLVKKLAVFANCYEAVGIDGAKKMIKKAQLNDPSSSYLNLDINYLQSYNSPFDIIFSMEVFYYLQSPENIIEHVYSNLLNKGGVFVLGMDHYTENKPSLAWPNDLQVELCTYSILQWQEIFITAGFSNISVSQFGNKDDWSGTLILYGEKL